LADLNIGQSCRAIIRVAFRITKRPGPIKEPDKLPEPVYPGQVGDQYLNREMLEKYYQPWIDLMKSGVGVHCGECGCLEQNAARCFPGLVWRCAGYSFLKRDWFCAVGVYR
jgi:hypothetical protein